MRGLGRGAGRPRRRGRSSVWQPRSGRRRRSAGSAVGERREGDGDPGKGKEIPAVPSAVLRVSDGSGGERGGREGGASASGWISGVQSVLSLWSKHQVICSGSAVCDGFSDGEGRARGEELFC